MSSIYMTSDELDATADVVRNLNDGREESPLSYVVDIYDLGDEYLGTVMKCDVGNYVFYAEPETD